MAIALKIVANVEYRFPSAKWACAEIHRRVPFEMVVPAILRIDRCTFSAELRCGISQMCVGKGRQRAILRVRGLHRIRSIFSERTNVE